MVKLVLSNLNVDFATRERKKIKLLRHIHIT